MNSCSSFAGNNFSNPFWTCFELSWELHRKYVWNPFGKSIGNYLRNNCGNFFCNSFTKFIKKPSNFLGQFLWKCFWKWLRNLILPFFSAVLLKPVVSIEINKNIPSKIPDGNYWISRETIWALFQEMTERIHEESVDFRKQNVSMEMLNKY